MNENPTETNSKPDFTQKAKDENYRNRDDELERVFNSDPDSHIKGSAVRPVLKEEDLSPEDLKKQGQYLEEISREKAEANRKKEDELNKIDTLPIDQVIDEFAKLAEFSEQQKEDWQKIKHLKFPQPKDGGVKLLTVIEGLENTQWAEKMSIQESLAVRYPNLTTVSVDYPEDPQKAKEALQSGITDIDGNNSDIVILFLSGHGYSPLVQQENGKVESEFIFMGGNEKNGLTGSDFVSVIKAYPNKQFVFIIDACYSGSIHDDAIAKLKNVTLIASSSGDQLSTSSEQKGLGSFIEKFNKYVKAGCELGEAFIRADAATLFDTGGQNPQLSVESSQNKRMIISSNLGVQSDNEMV